MHRDEQKRQYLWYKKNPKPNTQKKSSQNFEILPYISRITKHGLAALYPRRLSMHSHEKIEGIFVMCWAIHKNLVSLTELGQMYIKQSLDLLQS